MSDVVRLLSALDQASRRASFTPDEFLFPEQRAVRSDPSRFVTVDGTRRMGKTDLFAEALLGTAHAERRLCLYVAPTMVDARDTLWPRIKELNWEKSLGYTTTEGRPTLWHPGFKSEIRLRGAADEGQAQHLRGPPQGYDLAIIDEAQNFGASLKTLIADVLLPALLGAGKSGSLWVGGTPSIVPIGFWHDLVHSDGIWSHHRWSLEQNPHVQQGLAVIMAEAARVLGGRDTPAFRREWMGEWVADESALVFAFDAARNLFDVVPDGHMETVIGVDLGHHPDATAIAVEGWVPAAGSELYGVDEWVKTEQDLEQIADALEARIEKYRPLAVVIDEGGLGKMVAETIRRHRHLPVVAAEKADKLGAIHAYNTDLRQGRIRVRRDSRAAHDMCVIRWDEKQREAGKLAIAKRPHSDILDAKLYAHRRARHYLYEPTAVKSSDDDALFLDRLDRAQSSRDDEWSDWPRLGY